MVTTLVGERGGWLSGILGRSCLLIFWGVVVAWGGGAEASQLTHGSANIGSTKYGTWGEEYTCATCHVAGSSNIRMVRPVITTPIGPRPVIFRRMAAFDNASSGVFGNDERTYAQEGSTNVCEVCHHRTRYHQYSASKVATQPTGLTHTEHQSNNRDCMKCHSHRYGFRPPQAGECTDCHGNPPVPGTTLQTDILTYAGNPFGGSYGAHQKHYYVLGLNCATCHNGSVHGLLGNGYLELGFRIDDTTWPGFVGTVTTGTITLPSQANVVVDPGSPGTTLQRSPDTLTCSIYCHGDGWDSNKTPGAISWVNGPLPDCTSSSCHGTTPSRPPTPSVTTGAHPRHVGTNQYVCHTCHDQYLVPHMVNGRVKWNLSSQGGSATYKGFNAFSTNYVAGSAQTSYGQCTNVYCHSNVQGGSAGNQPPSSFGTVTWGGALLSCDGCHGGQKGDGSPIATGSHARHVSTYSYGCSDCHAGAGKSVETKHADRSIDVAFNPLYGGSYSQTTNQPGDGYGSCSSTYCHSDGKGTTATVGWGSGPLACVSCHGGDAASGRPITTGMHPQHVDNAALLGVNFGCAECHAGTVSSNSSVSSTSRHVNAFADFSGARAGRDRNSCNTAYCHSDGKGTPGVAVSWTAGPSLGCAGCHGSDPSPAFPSVAGEPNYPNAGPGQLRANSHQRHMGGYGLTACVYCHGNTVDASGNLTGSTLHLDGSPSVAAGGGRSFTYVPSTKTCADISCHGGPSPIQWGGSMPADCTGCHGNNAASAIPQTTGKHAAHMNNYSTLGRNYRCNTCHALTVNPDDRSIANPAFHGNGFKNFTGALVGGRSTYSTATGVCSSTYCHGDGKGKQNVPFTSENGWKSSATLDCRGCHGNDGSPAFVSTAGEPNYASSGPGTLRANSHQNHADTGAASCSSCHAATVAANGAILLNASTHTNRRIDVVAGAGHTFGYDPQTKSCSDISCHGGKGSFTQVWGNGLTPNCLGCHGNNVASGTPIALGSHTAHVNNASIIGANLNCTECHAKTINPDERSFANPSLHGNGFKDYSGVRAGGSASYSPVDGVCSASYCHTDGKGTQKMTPSTGWRSGATLDCRGCHGSDAAPAFSSTAGEPNYANAGAGQFRANSHQTHAAAGASSCDTCHTATVTASGTAIKAGGLHLDGQITVAFNTARATASWDSLSKSCSNISCHGGNSATWGDPGSAGCNVCHASLSGAHAIHTGDLIASGMVTFYNFTANRSSGTVYRFGCANCHPTSQLFHRNGTVDVTLNRNKPGAGALVQRNSLNTTDTAGYTKGAGSFTCETVYCHSNGRTDTLLAGDYRQTPNWYGGTFGPNRCGGCHDNPPQYAGQSHYNPASSIGNDGKSPARQTGHLINIHPFNTYVGNKGNGFLGFSSSGNVAHGNPAVATTLACYVCHSGIVSSTQIDTFAMDGTSSDFRCGSCHTASSRTRLQPGAIVDASLHVNGAKNVAFAPINFRTKAQLSNNANAQGWTRSGLYKTAGSYDYYDLSTSTWDPQTRTCLTACHVLQPGITWGANLKCVSCHANQ